MNEKQLKNSIFKGLIWRFAERCGAQGVSLIVSIILARLISPEEYGTLALLTVFTTILQVFVDSGLGNALIQKKQVDNIDFSTVFYFNMAICLSLYFAVYVSAPYIANFYNDTSLTKIIRVISLIVVISGLKNVQQAFVCRHMMFKRFFFSTLGGTISSAIIGIVMAYYGYGIWALVFQQLSNMLIDTIILWFTVQWRPQLTFSLKKLVKLLAFGWKLLLSSLLDTGYNQLRSLVIGKVYSSSDLAFYNKGQQFPQLIVNNINTSISSVLFPAISKCQDDFFMVKNMTRKAIKISSYIMWPLMIGLIIIAKPLTILLLTEKWLPSVVFLQIACLSYAFWPIHTANLEALKAIGRSDIFLRLEIVKKSIGILLLIISMNYGVKAIALSLFISSLVACLINSYPNELLLNYGYKDQFKDILPSFLLSCIMGIMIYPVSFFVKNNLLLLTVQVILGGLIYILLSRLFKIDSFTYLISFLKKTK